MFAGLRGERWGVIQYLDPTRRPNYLQFSGDIPINYVVIPPKL